MPSGQRRSGASEYAGATELTCTSAQERPALKRYVRACEQRNFPTALAVRRSSTGSAKNERTMRGELAEAVAWEPAPFSYLGVSLFCNNCPTKARDLPTRTAITDSRQHAAGLSAGTLNIRTHESALALLLG